MAGVVYGFGAFQLDPTSRTLTKDGVPVVLSARQFDLLHLLVARAGVVLSKDALIDAAWAGVAVTDNSVEQAVSALRRVLTSHGADSIIETQARRGYRFAANVQRTERREPDEGLEGLLAPHRAWIEGRAALETLERSQIVHARAVFERVIAQVPDQAAAHVGLANAGVMQFEMTRSDHTPDAAALAVAFRHAREACRLDPQYGEGWATLGFVLDRTGHHTDALAASRRAVSLEPDNWRHHVRLAYVSWGEERLREARRTLGLLPGFPMAHWLAATVHVARHALDAAERELRDGLIAQSNQAHGARARGAQAHGVQVQDAEVQGSEGNHGSHAPGHQAHGNAARGRFTGVALHWLLGLILLARDDEGGALEQFELELAAEGSGQLYARECCANTWYAIGALRLRRGDGPAAIAAFDETLRRVPVHPLALAARFAIHARGIKESGVQASVDRVARDTQAADAGVVRGAETLDDRVARDSQVSEERVAPGPHVVDTQHLLDIWALPQLGGDAERLRTMQPELALARAITSRLRDDAAGAVFMIESALAAAPPGSALWLLPVEPLLRIGGDDRWSAALASLRNRAA